MVHGLAIVDVPPCPKIASRQAAAGLRELAAEAISASRYARSGKLSSPRKLMCEKCAGPMRRSQSSSMVVPLSRRLRTVSSIWATFQASTTLVNKACEPEMAIISSALRPRSGAIRPK